MAYEIDLWNSSYRSYKHNIRDENNIDPDINPNGVYEIWNDESVQEAYSRLFSKSLKDYNSRPSRSGQKIRNYYNHIIKDKRRRTCYEMTVYVDGCHDTPDCRTGKDILRHFVDDWKKRNPNMEMIGAYYHADEYDISQHVHIDYIPVGHGYKRGMEIQTSFNKALEEQGFITKEGTYAFKFWLQSEKQRLKDICYSYGVEVSPFEKGESDEN